MKGGRFVLESRRRLNRRRSGRRVYSQKKSGEKPNLPRKGSNQAKASAKIDRLGLSEREMRGPRKSEGPLSEKKGESPQSIGGGAWKKKWEGAVMKRAKRKSKSVMTISLSSGSSK